LLVEPGPQAYEPFRRARLLLVHDSATALVRLRHLLEQEGYEVSTSADGAEALGADAGSYDCVLAPVSAARLDGLALCHALDERRGSLPSPFQIVALGGADDREALNAAFDAGADEVAPHEPAEDMLRIRVRALMRRKLLAEETRRANQDLVAREVAVATAEAKAAAAEALSQANAELAAANHQLREAQSQLVQAAKMASLGELVAGIAHEINNPLAFILGHQDTVDREIAKARASGEVSGAAQAALQKASDRSAAMRLGLKRIQGLVLNLRKFSRMEGGDRQQLDVADAIATVLALLAPKLGGIEVRREFAAEGALEGSPALLNQVVMNIVSNAADALSGAGVISITTRSNDRDYMIEIGDSGPGVPADLRDRLFEPFFTTKPVGSGTGLGLAIAYRIVEAHHGRIDIGTSPLGGAQFTVVVPRNT
jgi:two-component system NtrC family sensor kinase